MKTIVDLEPVLAQMGATAKNVANWLDRMPALRETMPPTLPGQFRRFSRKQALIIVSFAAFVRSGAEPKAALPLAKRFAAMSNFKSTIKWVIYARGDFQTDIGVNHTDISLIWNETGGPTPVCFVPLGEIRRQIDELYDVHSE